MPTSISYYNEHAEDYFAATVNADMASVHDRFISLVRPGGLVLDAGCGSGRDAAAFQRRGFRVEAFDASAELAALATQNIGCAVAVRTFADFSEQSRYDGIWACASLLHVPRAELPGTLQRLWVALKPGGAFYLSFKQGSEDRLVDGRRFTDVEENELRGWLEGMPDIASVDFWSSTDVRPDRSDRWINAIARRRSHLVTGGEDPFLPHLRNAISRSDEIDLAVAFVLSTGLRLLLTDLHASLSPTLESGRGPARIRILTSDYLDVTDPAALRSLLLLQEAGADVRVFHTGGGHSFHLKAYLFGRRAGEGAEGVAFIGSSNISRQALLDGLEWNYRADYPPDVGFLEARDHFNRLFESARSVPLTDAWIEGYEARRAPPPMPVAPGTQEKDPPPVPTTVQSEALQALAETRRNGFRSGLVVLATGLGKTWLAAFDAQQAGARRVLFVAHREEILNQAAETFLRVRPRARVGFYMGQQRDTTVDVLCASVQTLGRADHLNRFPPQHFDYIVVDEFHHAAAATYRRVLGHFVSHFLLGLTATPDRTDQSDILSLCDDNLVFTCSLLDGIRSGLLAPFHYFGISDESVDYQAIPWRNGRFDPEALSNKLATLGRARHVLREWRARHQSRTLAFCASTRHAEFMAEYFRREGVSCAAVYSGSMTSRSDALDQLRDRRLEVIFTVDLFNEGVDLPLLDTVMMLRPTESKIIFLQQLGRGLRRAEGKERLVALDFIGNHKSLLHKPAAFLAGEADYRRLAEFARKLDEGRLDLPEGCYLNFPLELIELLKSLDAGGPEKQYQALREVLGHRPTLTEFYRSGSSVADMRREHGGWFQLVDAMGDLASDDQATARAHRDFLREVETTSMTKSYKMVLLDAFQELDGWHIAPDLGVLAARSRDVLERRRMLLADLPAELREEGLGVREAWLEYWYSNPINAWIGGNRGPGFRSYFKIDGGRFSPTFEVKAGELDAMRELVQELVDYRLASYETRLASSESSENVVTLRGGTRGTGMEVPYFPNLKMACGQFRAGRADSEEYRSVGPEFGSLVPERHFIARATGNSMDGGTRPIRDGEYILFERAGPDFSDALVDAVVAIERSAGQDEDKQYLLRRLVKDAGGAYVLKAQNPDYEDLAIAYDMRVPAKMVAALRPADMALGKAFPREEIPALFGEEFNPGNWHAGHVVLEKQKAHVLLVTLNKRGKQEDHRYVDRWIDECTFHWQTQNSTSPSSKKGRAVVNHVHLGIDIHLFVRDNKLAQGKAAPFTYYGKVTYVRHEGSNPMSVTFDVPSMRSPEHS